jgi:aldose 1-epimerase
MATPATRQPEVTEEPIGEVGGRPVHRYGLTNTAGMQVEIISYGGIIGSVQFPDRNGQRANIVLGFKTLEEYVKYNPVPTPANPSGAGTYFGALIGRYANRITGGRLEIDGDHHLVPINHGVNALHGGNVGFDQKVWSATVVRDELAVGLRLEYVSPDGEMGFPGTLRVVAEYSLDNHNRLELRFKATTDAPTLVNLTNHTYWNLAGEPTGTVYDQVLSINADSFTPVNEALTPTGEVAPVAGTPFDFRTPTAIGARIRQGDPQLITGLGYDHNWVLNQTRPRSMVLAATALDPGTGRGLNVHTTQPGIQFYSGNFLDGMVNGTSGRAYRQSDGFALETQHFPDSPNHPTFPSTVLRPGEIYEQATIFELFCDS